MNRSHVFLKAYAETGNVERAAEAAQIHKSIHYRRLKTDPEYQAAFERAHEVAVGMLEDAAVERAVRGVRRTKYFQGIPCGDEIVYSDALLMFLLRGEKPAKYRDRHEISGSVDHQLKFQGSLEELLATYRHLTSQETAQNEPPEA